MVMCKFYQQGYCRFGDSCKFEHEQKGQQQMWGFSPLVQQPQLQTFNSAPKQTQNPANVDTSTLVKSVTTDMLGAEKGGQWLLSCYAPFKEKPEFPGFEDYSLEEIRIMFYEAKANGTIEQVKQQYQSMLQQAMMKIKALQNPSPEVINVLRQIFNTPPKSTVINNQLTGTQNSVFGSGTTSNVFQQKPQQVVTPSTNIFAAGNQKLFSNTAAPSSNTIFGGNPNNVQQQQSSIFNNGNNNNNNNILNGSSIFSGGESNSIFGGAGAGTSVNNSVFSNQQPQQSSNGIFGTVQATNQSVFGNSQVVPTTSSNVFGLNQPSFGSSPFANPHSSVFSPQQQTSTANIFGQPNVNVIETSTQPTKPLFFSTAQPINNNTSNIFSNNNTTVFSQPQTTNSIFTQQGTTSTNSNMANIFANSMGSTVVSSRPQPPSHQEHAYSKIEELSESDIKWFQSEDLDLENIPDKPPTYEMCF